MDDAAQLGLRYGEAVQLGVRYVLDDVGQEGVRGSVRFSFFGDPGGSTLSRDTVQTDSTGTAHVTLTAGSQEGTSFSVHASAAGAADAVFDVSVSKLQFVNVDAVLVDPLPKPGTRSFAAALFAGKTCAQVPAAPTLVGASRTVSAAPAASATLSFQKLLSGTYALVGRVESMGDLVAYGCIDLPAAVVPPGTFLSVPVPLVAISPDPRGSYTLSTSLAAPRSARSDSRFGPVDIVDRCPGHVAQLLLDAITSEAPTARQTLLDAQRGAAAPSTSGTSTVSCRPALVGTDDSLDAQLGALIDATTDGAQRAALVGDLDTILGSGTLTSTLSLAATLAHAADPPAVGSRYVGTHTATTVGFSLGTPHDLAALGVPARSANGIDVTAAAGRLGIGRHVLGLELPVLWGETFSTASVAARLPALTDATWSGWLQSAVAAVQHDGKTGCAAITALLCEQTGATGCAGTLDGPCADAVTSVGDALEATFAGDAGLALVGSATLVDSNGDLVTDSITAGAFTSSGPLDAVLAFRGTKVK
ncbi:MAG: hypothetical protein ABI321_05265 [Polyangia bacterium]